MIATLSMASLRLENFAGTVWLSAGAPATFQRAVDEHRGVLRRRVRAGLLGAGTAGGRMGRVVALACSGRTWAVALDGPDWPLLPDVLRLSCAGRRGGGWPFSALGAEFCCAG